MPLQQDLLRYLLSRKEPLMAVSKQCLWCKKSRKVIIQTKKLNFKINHLPIALHQVNVTITRLIHSVTRVSQKDKTWRLFQIWPNAQNTTKKW